MVRSVTENEREQYRSPRVVKLPGFVPAETVTQMLQALDHRLANPGEETGNDAIAQNPANIVNAR